jgi:hypothetical protein
MGHLLVIFTFVLSSAGFAAGAGCAGQASQIQAQLQNCVQQAGSDPKAQQRCQQDAMKQSSGCTDQDGNATGFIAGLENQYYNSEIKDAKPEANTGSWVQDCIAKCPTCQSQCVAAGKINDE